MGSEQVEEIEAYEVYEFLINLSQPVLTKNERNQGEPFTGDIAFKVDGYEVSCLVVMDSLVHIYSIKSTDGKKVGTFDLWDYDGISPLQMLEESEYVNLQNNVIGKLKESA